MFGVKKNALFDGSKNCICDDKNHYKYMMV